MITAQESEKTATLIKRNDKRNEAKVISVLIYAQKDLQSRRQPI